MHADKMIVDEIPKVWQYLDVHYLLWYNRYVSIGRLYNLFLYN